MDTNINADLLKGGEFIIKNIEADKVFIPEEFTEEQQMVITTMKDFFAKRYHPNRAQIESLDIDLSCKLMEEMGDLGLLGIPFPEEFGGSEMDFVTNVLLSELIAESRSFSLTYGAHTSIGLLPLLYFGNDTQKQKYLPDMIAGKLIGAYCLTEPGSGSDAMAAKTSVKLSEDGQHYIMNGQKMWITNAGFADMFTVFAKIDGQHFTGFLVEKSFEGISLGEEEKKMGIKGSSTRQVFFENVKVPVENLLGQPGKGHIIAFNILNIGRIKLAASVVGGSKIALSYAINYANERKQFKQSISNFGAIQHKLAESAIRIYANESAIYRASDQIRHKEEQLMEAGKTLGEALLGAADEYAIECALLKVTGSECLDFCVDEGVQILGGMGYSEEMDMASAYRDARINRIFEGTNEINRLLSVDMLFKKAMSGHIDFANAAMKVQQELMSGEVEQTTFEGPLARESQLIVNMKKAFLMLAGATAQQFNAGLQTEQEILMNISDMMADVFLAESALLRTQKLIKNRGVSEVESQVLMTQVFFDEAIERFALNGRRCINSWAEGELQKTLHIGFKKLTKYIGINTKEKRRLIAKNLIAANQYCF